MSKRASFLLGFLLVLSACSSPVTVEPAATEAPAATTQDSAAPASTDTAPSTVGQASPDTEAPMLPVPDGPPAPDFTLALGDGRSFTLSEESKPVYMIFWAEW